MSHRHLWTSSTPELVRSLGELMIAAVAPKAADALSIWRNELIVPRAPQAVDEACPVTPDL